MNANELRIGNVVQYRDEGICEVSNIGNYFETINNKGIVYGSDDINEYNGVRLTEKRLLNLGFEYYEPLDHYRIVINDVWYSVKINYNLFYGFWFTFVNLNWDETKEMPYKKVNYVHQLQNLFFALTNEELTIINE